MGGRSVAGFFFFFKKKQRKNKAFFYILSILLANLQDWLVTHATQMQSAENKKSTFMVSPQ